MPALSQGGEQSQSLLEWSGPDCSVFSVSNQAGFWGKCGQALAAAPGIDPTQEPLKHWLQAFAPFETNTPAGKLKFVGLGSGSTVASEAEQRSMAEWAKLQFDIAQSGRAGAAWGLAFGYHREGGIAGFCDDVAVWLDGRVQISNCKGFNVTRSLSASELVQVYAWFDGLKQVDYSYSDPATADAIKIVLTMPSQGAKTADDATVRAIVEFASGLVDQAGFTAKAGPEVSSAQQALETYFKALNSGDFAQGAKLYGGPTDLLQTWNPDIKNDLPAWLAAACQHNGLVCMLPRSIRYRGPDSREGAQFIVEFNNLDGTLFVQGPCCGEVSSAPGISSFVFAVTRSGGQWAVLDLPPYVP
jgi:hypothetical protein